MFALEKTGGGRREGEEKNKAQEGRDWDDRKRWILDRGKTEKNKKYEGKETQEVQVEVKINELGKGKEEEQEKEGTRKKESRRRSKRRRRRRRKMTGQLKRRMAMMMTTKIISNPFGFLDPGS